MRDVRSATEKKEERESGETRVRESFFPMPGFCTDMTSAPKGRVALSVWHGRALSVLSPSCERIYPPWKPRILTARRKYLILESTQKHSRPPEFIYLSLVARFLSLSFFLFYLSSYLISKRLNSKFIILLLMLYCIQQSFYIHLFI